MRPGRCVGNGEEGGRSNFTVTGILEVGALILLLRLLVDLNAERAKPFVIDVSKALAYILRANRTVARGTLHDS